MTKALYSPSRGKFTLALIVFGLSQLCNADMITGFVYNMQSFEKDYEEIHHINELIHEVNYKNLEGERFANKVINYSSGLSTPSIDFNNSHCDESYQIKSQSGSNKVQSFYSNSCDDNKSQGKIRMESPYVVDAGFDHFIRQNLSTIETKTLSFDYPSPSRSSNISLKAKSFSCKKLIKDLSTLLSQIDTNHNNKSQWQRCVMVRANNWFIAQFLPAIYLAYDNDGFLALYTGRSNMSDKDGKYQDIAIFYHLENPISKQGQ